MAKKPSMKEEFKAYMETLEFSDIHNQLIPDWLDMAGYPKTLGNIAVCSGVYLRNMKNLILTGLKQ